MIVKYIRWTWAAIMLFFFSFVHLSAQTHQVGVFLGGSNYVGDLVSGIVEMRETHGAIGAFGQLGLHPYLSFRVSATYGNISGSDVNNDRPDLQSRNLSFQSSILEGSFQLIGHILADKKKFDPYVLVGISAFHFNPKAFYEGEWVELQPLGTEGQELVFGGERKYNRLQLAIPMGGGIQFHTEGGLIWGLEMGYRKTFTDYLDDVSTVYPNRSVLLENRGELAVALSDRSGEFLGDASFKEEGTGRGGADYKDGYFFVGIMASLRLGDGRIGGGGKSQRCYDF